MDHGELLWEALWLTIQHPRGDHEALWALCWKSSMTSGIEFRASLLSTRQLQLCSSGPWLDFGDMLVGDRLASSALLSQWRRFFRCHLEAPEQQILRQRSLPAIPASDPCTYRCLTFSTKQPPESCLSWGS